MSIAPSLDPQPGWYGKLPSLGDFARRRLPDEFVPAWDAWLQSGLQAARSAFGEGWLDTYLTMPIWRFVLLPGLLGPSGWAGVVMPSVDRVGRQFPLTVAVSLSSYASAAYAVFRGGDWFAGLEEAALTVLDPVCTPHDFDQMLAECLFTGSWTEEVGGAGGVVRRLPSAEAFEALAGAEALRAWGRHADWKALWWTRGRVDGDALMLSSAELPTPKEFAWLVHSRSNGDPRGGTAGAAPNADP